MPKVFGIEEWLEMFHTQLKNAKFYLDKGDTKTTKEILEHMENTLNMEVKISVYDE